MAKVRELSEGGSRDIEEKFQFMVGLSCQEIMSEVSQKLGAASIYTSRTDLSCHHSHHKYLHVLQLSE